MDNYNFTFLSNEEIKYYDKYLRSFMRNKYKYIDEDILQETFIDIFKKADKFNPNLSQKKTWITMILISKFNNKFNKSKKIKLLYIEENNLNEILNDEIENKEIYEIKDHYLIIVKSIIKNNIEFKEINDNIFNKKKYQDIVDEHNLLNDNKININIVKRKIFKQRKELRRLLNLYIKSKLE